MATAVSAALVAGCGDDAKPHAGGAGSGGSSGASVAGSSGAGRGGSSGGTTGSGGAVAGAGAGGDGAGGAVGGNAGSKTSAGGSGNASGSAGETGLGGDLGAGGDGAGSPGAAGDEGTGGDQGDAGDGGGSGEAGGVAGESGSSNAGGNAGSGGISGSGGVSGSGGISGSGGVSGSGGKAGVGGSAGSAGGSGGVVGAGGSSSGCMTMGHHVSRDTCSAIECGTIAQPFCTIARGVQNTPDGLVLVAGSANRYAESIVMSAGLTIRGGYTTDFSGQRSYAGAGSTKVFGRATIPGNVTATLDGVEMLLARAANAPGNPPAQDVVIQVSSGSARLRDVSVNVSLDAAERTRVLATSAFAVRAMIPAGGVLDLSGGVINAPRGIDASTALEITGDGRASIDGAELAGGPATTSTGIAQRARGTLDVGAASVRGPLGNSNGFGIIAEPLTDVTPGAVRVTDSTVRGDSESAVNEPGRSVDGTHIGILARDVPLTVRGSDVVGAPFNPARAAHGVTVEGTLTTTLPVEISGNSRLEGGGANPNSFSRLSTGVFAVGAVDLQVHDNLVIRGVSRVSEARSAGVQLIAGARFFTGSVGSYASVFLTPGQGLPVWSIHNNTSIVGGPGGNSSIGDPHDGIAAQGTFRTATPVPLTISHNGLIAGSDVVGQPAATASGVRAIYGLNLIMERNVIGAAPSASAGAAVNVARNLPPAPDDTPFRAQIRDNLIDGRVYENASGYPTNGMILRGVAATVERNLIRHAQTGLHAAIDVDSTYTNNFIFGVRTACVIGCPFGDHCSNNTSLNFSHNLCHAAGSTATSLAVGGVIVPRAGVPSAVSNNIFDVSAAATDRSCLEVLAGFGSNQAAFDNNDFVVHPGVVSGQRFSCVIKRLGGDPNPTTCRDLGTIATGSVTATGNVSIVPSYAAPDQTNPTTAGYALGSACNLSGLGKTSSSVPADYFGMTRGTPPEIGPSECP
jgi:hypothetical protein